MRPRDRAIARWGYWAGVASVTLPGERDDRLADVDSLTAMLLHSGRVNFEANSPQPSFREEAGASFARITRHRWGR